jgi:hypothetical protein
MTPSKEIRNFAASVRQRLLNRAREHGVDFNLVLQRYAIERFLYRLSLSSEVDRFTLKGATLFLVWAGQEFRPTRDVDLLGAGPEDHAAIRHAVEAICTLQFPDDGIVFDPGSIRIDDIRDEQEYGGVRVRLQGNLGQARLPLQVDIGFGDVITPNREEQDYPTLLDHPAPRLWAYPRETFVAEKFEAMVRLGRPNSRVKDLWDVAAVARRFTFDGETLRSAIDETFRQRRTSLANERPEALRPAFYEDPMRARRWQEFQRQVEGGGHGPVRLVEVGEEVSRFLGPVCDSLIGGEAFTLVWAAGGPWQLGVYKVEGGEGDG